ncbi:hypothetical protein FQZ97_861180 [compost metagenome]
MRVHAGLHGAAAGFQVEGLAGRRRAAKFAGEAVQPVFQIQQLRLGLSPARQLQDVFDHQVHPPRVILDYLRQALIRALQVFRLL